MIKRLRNVKLGNMRLAADWVVYPADLRGAAVQAVTIQCDRRIARVDLETGRTLLSDGKGGHQGFAKLAFGSIVCDCPPEALAALRAMDHSSSTVLLAGREEQSP
jgi:hypothetical protein